MCLCQLCGVCCIHHMARKDGREEVVWRGLQRVSQVRERSSQPPCGNVMREGGKVEVMEAGEGER